MHYTSFFRTLLLTLLVAAIVGATPAEAQLLKRLKDRAKQRVEQKVEDQANRAVDRGVDAAEDIVEDAAKTALERKIEERMAESGGEAVAVGPNETGQPRADFVQYRTVSRMALGGGMGPFMRMLGMDDQVEMTYVHGSRIRTDEPDGSSSLILDASDGSYIMLNHEDQTYVAMSLEEMLDMAQQQLTQAQAQLKEVQGSAGTDQEMPDTEVEFDFQAYPDRATETILGVSATQHVTVMATRYTIEMDDENGQPQTLTNTSYMVTDTWMTEGLSGYQTIEDLYREMGENALSAMGSENMAALGASMAGAMGGGIDMTASMERMQEEMARIESTGLAVRTVMHMVNVPEGQELDLEAVLATDIEMPEGGDEGGLAGLMQMSDQLAAQQAASMGSTEQTVTMSMVTEIGDLTTEAFDTALLQVPSGYREVSFQELLQACQE
ncbi:MAG: hypothetical protein AAF970_04145 [Bacteroidota bacterium]